MSHTSQFNTEFDSSCTALPQPGTVHVFDSDDEFAVNVDTHSNDDEFSVPTNKTLMTALPTSTQIVNVQGTQPTTHSIIETQDIGKPFYVGQRFLTANLEEVRDFIKQRAKSENFLASTLKGSKLADLPGHRKLGMGCCRSGASWKQKKMLQNVHGGEKDGEGQGKNSRLSSSQKCGCGWKIWVKLDTQLQQCIVTSTSLEHTNGCNPSREQHQVSLKRAGKYLLKIPVGLASTLSLQLSSKKRKLSNIKHLLEQHHVLPDGFPVTSRFLINLKARLDRVGDKLSDWQHTHFELDNEYIWEGDEIDGVATIKIEEHARRLLKELINVEGYASVVKVFENLKSSFDGFEFRIAVDSNQMLTGWLFMTAEMRYLCQKFAQILFLDAKKSAVSAVNWPYYGICVLDDENQLRIICYCLCVHESTEAYCWILNAMASIVPSLHEITEVLMTDRLANEEALLACLRSLKLAGLCNWHLRESNLSEWVKYNPSRSQILQEFNNCLQSPDISFVEWEANFNDFKTKWGGKAAEFADSVYAERHRWASPWTHRFFLAFKTGNTMAEVGNSSISAHLDGVLNHAELVQSLLFHNTQSNTALRNRINTHCVMKSTVQYKYQDLDSAVVWPLREQFSDFICNKFKEELLESPEYEAEAIEMGKDLGLVTVWKVWRKSQTLKFRTVRLDQEQGLLRCSCLTGPSTGCPCRHICCCLARMHSNCAEQSYFLYFHSRWARMHFFPSFQDMNLDNPVQFKAIFKQADQDESNNSVEFNSDTTAPEKKKKKTKMQQNYAKVLTAAEKLAGFVSHSSELTSMVLTAMAGMEADLRAGKAISYDCAQPAGSIFNDATSVCSDVALNINDNTLYPLHTPGRHQTKRLANRGIIEPHHNRRAGRPPQNSKRRDDGPKKHTNCSVCQQSDCPRKGPNCPKLANIGKLVKPEGYASILAMEPTTDWIPAQCECTKASFNSAWQHVVLRQICKDAHNTKHYSIISVQPDLSWQSQQQLYSEGALRYWLENKATKKHLLTRFITDLRVESGLQQPLIRKVSFKFSQNT